LLSYDICSPQILPQNTPSPFSYFFFFFNDTATTEIYTVGNTLSPHDALPISRDAPAGHRVPGAGRDDSRRRRTARPAADRSEEHTSELQSLPTISYAVLC